MQVQIQSNHPSFEIADRRSQIRRTIQDPRSKINFPGAVAERRMHFIVDEDDDGSSPFGPATICTFNVHARVAGYSM